MIKLQYNSDYIRSVVNRYHAAFGTQRHRVQFPALRHFAVIAAGGLEFCRAGELPAGSYSIAAEPRPLLRLLLLLRRKQFAVFQHHTQAEQLPRLFVLMDGIKRLFYALDIIKSDLHSA